MEEMKELAAAPQNLARKASALRSSYGNLEGLQRGYAPIFDEDEVITSLRAQIWAEYENVMAQLRQFDEETKNQITFD